MLHKLLNKVVLRLEQENNRWTNECNFFHVSWIRFERKWVHHLFLPWNYFGYKCDNIYHSLLIIVHYNYWYWIVKTTYCIWLISNQLCSIDQSLVIFTREYLLKLLVFECLFLKVNNNIISRNKTYNYAYLLGK